VYEHQHAGQDSAEANKSGQLYVTSLRIMLQLTGAFAIRLEQCGIEVKKEGQERRSRKKINKEGQQRGHYSD
jgi:hypothetical protein